MILILEEWCKRIARCFTANGFYRNSAHDSLFTSEAREKKQKEEKVTVIKKTTNKRNNQIEKIINK